MRSGGIVHRRLPPDGIVSTRQPVRAETTDRENEAEVFDELSLQRLSEQIGNLARAVANTAMPVDEYNSAAISGAGSSVSVKVTPQYEFVPEKITSIIVTGPSGNITLQIGDRTWALTVPTSGLLVIAPLALLLSRTDDRILTPATPGVYTLELMGTADRRFAA